jgi:2-methylcitrate dehydratase PrpD
MDDRDLVTQLTQLGDFASSYRYASLDQMTREALTRVIFDNFTVTIAGSELAESTRLRRAIPQLQGGTTVLGSEVGYPMTDAVWLNGIAMVSLELDEGNKAIRGHASAHVFPLAIGLAEALDVPGSAFLEAFLAGHEVASRFGNAIVLHAGLHPHGNWGVTGAAAASARLLGLTAQQTARAIDNAATQALATPFAAALHGMAIRNSWIGAANILGYQAALTASVEDDVTVNGMGDYVFGDMLGQLDLSNLASDLGATFFVTSGYFKRHASCSYTHPPADAALALRQQLTPFDVADIEDVLVETHHLATPLATTQWPSRIAAMFSIPYVVATALKDGDCAPLRFDATARGDHERLALATKVRIRLEPSIDSRLPNERGARLTVRLTNGQQLQVSVANPVGDADCGPFKEAELLTKSTALLGGERAEQLLTAVNALATAPSMRSWMTQLRTIVASGDDAKERETA